MSTEITRIEKLDPKDFGLDEANVATIEQAFKPKILERDALVPLYEELTKKELTPELCSDFHALRMRCVKVRTGIAEVHKTQKAYFLAAGRFVDAWKNKETVPIEQMEEKLRDGEEYFERLEAKRIADLETERKEKLAPYSDIFPEGLGRLSDESFNTYLTGAKVACEARMKAEEERRKAEEEESERLRIAAERKERDDNRFRILAGTGLQFSDGKFHCEGLDVYYSECCELSDEDFITKVKEITTYVSNKKKEEEKRRAEELAEKKRLEEIAEAKERELAEERLRAEAERKKQEEILKAERERQEEALRLEREKAERLIAEQEAKAAAEAEALRKAQSAPDIEKLRLLAERIDATLLPDVTGEDARKLVNGVRIMLGKTTTYLREKIKEMEK